MAVFESNRDASVVSVAAFRVVSLAERVVKAARAKLVAERTHAQLSRLTPAQLRDIGLADQDLHEVSRTMAARSL
ncbi:MAG: DUF1127 domain-containing protein [Pseudomonadota bacterium]